MLRTIKPSTILLTALFCAVVFSAIAWQNKPVKKATASTEDTIPGKKKIKEEKTVITGDIDKSIEELDHANEKIERQLESKDFEKIHRQLEESLENLQKEKIQEQLARAMKDIDIEHMQLQAQKALKQVDMQKVQKELQMAQDKIQREINSPKIQLEMQKAMKESRKAMENLKDIDLQKVQENLDNAKELIALNRVEMQENIERINKNIQENLHKNFRENFEKLNENLNKTRKELVNYKAMMLQMNKDGLLKADGTYDIHYKNGELYIDGKLQPSSVTDKYKEYFKKGDVRIRKTKDGEDERTIDL